MPPKHILILGAGPTGLSAALALSKLSTPDLDLHVTVMELRSEPHTIGGAVNLTPLALRYLDHLGALPRLRPRGAPVRSIDIVSLRTGKSLGSLWAGLDALRVRRADIVNSLLDAVQSSEHVGRITVRFGIKVVSIKEEGTTDGDGKVILTFENSETIEGDVLLGCDGLHSVVRRIYVEPERQELYSGKACAYGFVKADEPGKVDVKRADGKLALADTTMVSGRYGSLLMSFFEPTREQVYLTAIMEMKDEHEGSKEGWRAQGKDQETVKKDILRRFKGTGHVPGLDKLVESCEEWCLYPVYILPPGGKWSRGRVLLLGDAAHAMPPQGESIGISIEDAVLIARIFERRESRSISQLFKDYESVREAEIAKHYKTASFRWDTAKDAGWLFSILLEWITRVYVVFWNWKGQDHFASDVRTLPLPP